MTTILSFSLHVQARAVSSLIAGFIWRRHDDRQGGMAAPVTRHGGAALRGNFRRFILSYSQAVTREDQSFQRSASITWPVEEILMMLDIFVADMSPVAPVLHFQDTSSRAVCEVRKQ